MPKKTVRIVEPQSPTPMRQEIVQTDTHSLEVSDHVEESGIIIFICETMIIMIHSTVVLCMPYVGGEVVQKVLGHSLSTLLG